VGFALWWEGESSRRWRVGLGVAVAGVLAGTLVQATPELAQAAPSSVEPPAAPEASAPADEDSASDAVSARTIARLYDHQVEVLGLRTESSSTWANADGTLMQSQFFAPVWVRQGEGDGTKVEDWSTVDLTLSARSDGTVAPAAHPQGMVLSGGAPGVGPAEQVPTAGEELRLRPTPLVS